MERQRTDGGFTLVEVMVAMLVLALVAGATVSIIASSLRTTAENADRVQAASIARSELERLRGLGAADIPIGRSVSTAYPGFTVTTTANWQFAQPGSPCQVAGSQTPKRTNAQVHIEVIGDRLGAPQVLDAIVPPSTEVPAIPSGSVTAWVRDEQLTPQPVGGITVTASSQAVGAVSQSAITGPDGCVFFTDLVPGSWTITASVASPSMVRPGTESTVVIPALEVGQNVPISYYVAVSTAIELSAGTPEFPIPAGLPLRMTLGSWAGVSPQVIDPAGVRVPAAGQPLLWPDPVGYTARIGCADAADAQAIAVRPGAVSAVALPVTGIEVQGPRGASVTITHAADAVCADAVTLDPGVLAAVTGVASSDGKLQTALPAGTWTVSVVGQPSQTIVIDATTPAPCTVTWIPAEPTDPDAVAPSPSPTASALPRLAPTYALCPLAVMP